MNHKNGVKSAAIVQRHGVRLLPELFEVFNPMPFDVAVAMEEELAEDLRRQDQVEIPLLRVTQYLKGPAWPNHSGKYHICVNHHP